MLNKTNPPKPPSGLYVLELRGALAHCTVETALICTLHHITHWLEETGRLEREPTWGDLLWLPD
jgi:hypothetical protein